MDNADFNIENEDINYSYLHQFNDDDEFRARLYALKWTQQNYKKSKLKPYTVSIGDEHINKWKNYLVLLIGEGGENKIAKVCFPNNLEDNFAIITLFNKQCGEKIMKINEYKILDNEVTNSGNEKEKEKIKEPKKEKDILGEESHNKEIAHNVAKKNNIIKQKNKKYEKGKDIINNIVIKSLDKVNKTEGSKSETKSSKNKNKETAPFQVVKSSKKTLDETDKLDDDLSVEDIK